MLEQFKTQYQKPYTNDAEELKRYVIFGKSKAHVVKLNVLNHEPVFGITSMSNSMTIKGKNTIMKERSWINCVVSEIVFQASHSDTDTPSEMRSVSLQFERNPIHTSCSTREMSQMKWRHPGNFLNVSYRLKVNEFASLMRQSSCHGTKGDKPNNV